MCRCGEAAKAVAATRTVVGIGSCCSSRPFSKTLSALSYRSMCTQVAQTPHRKGRSHNAVQWLHPDTVASSSSSEFGLQDLARRHQTDRGDRDRHCIDAAEEAGAGIGERGAGRRERGGVAVAGARPAGVAPDPGPGRWHLNIGAVPGLQEALDTGAAGQFYTLDGAARLHQQVADIQSGRIVVLVAAVPFKCPAARSGPPC